MKAELLKRLRKEAKQKVYLYPYEGKEDLVIIVDDRRIDIENMFDTAYVGKSMSWERNGKFKNEDESLIFHPNKEYVWNPFTITEAVEVLDALRRRYIQFEVNALRGRQHRQKMNCQDESLIKKLKAY